MTSLLALSFRCDAISGARPGARRENSRSLYQTIEWPRTVGHVLSGGVTKTYAIQAGRELRVIVGADKIDDK